MQKEKGEGEFASAELVSISPSSLMAQASYVNYPFFFFGGGGGGVLVSINYQTLETSSSQSEFNYLSTNIFFRTKKVRCVCLPGCLCPSRVSCLSYFNILIMFNAK